LNSIVSLHPLLVAVSIRKNPFTKVISFLIWLNPSPSVVLFWLNPFPLSSTQREIISFSSVSTPFYIPVQVLINTSKVLGDSKNKKETKK